MPIALLVVTLGLLGALAACAAHAADFQATTATYLGGAEGEEEWSAVDAAPDGTLVVGATAPSFQAPGVKPVELLGGGYGLVLRLNAEGTQVLSATRLGDYIEDLEVGEDGAIAVTGSFGAALLSADGASLLWHDASIIRGSKSAQFRNQTPPFKLARYTRRVARIAIGADGTVASIQSDEKIHSAAPKKGFLYIWARDGRRLATVPLVKYKYLKDVCVSAKHQLVILGGFNTYAADSPHMKDHPIHMPFLTAYSYDGQEKWEDYNFPAKDSYAQNTYADSRVQRLAIGRDGFLYMGGYIHGGDYVWKHDPRDVTKRLKRDTGYDSYSTASNMGRGIDQGYFAKFDPATGEFLQGQVLLCRVKPDGSGKPSQIQIRGIQADEQGNVFLSGYCEAYIRERAAQTVNGVAVGEYHKPEPFLLAVSPDFRQRHVWTVFAKRCEAASWGLTVRGGRGALIAEVYEGELITSENALQKAPPSGRCGYLVTFDAQKVVGAPAK